MSARDGRADTPGAPWAEECSLHAMGGHGASGHDIVPSGTVRGGAPPQPAPAPNGAAPKGTGPNGAVANGTDPTGAVPNGAGLNAAAPNGPGAGGPEARAAVPSAVRAPLPQGMPADAGSGGRAANGAVAETQWGRAVELIEAADEVCLACHIAPDGDALGSMLALAQALHAMGKRCLASFGEPFAVPAILRFLPGQEFLVEPARMPAAPALMISLDAAGQARLGSLAGAAGRAGSLIVIDHHASNVGFGGVRLVDPDAAATAVLVEELIRRLGVPLDGDIAQGLYAGLASDTGSFKYPCTTPEVHDLAGRLLTAGVRPEAVSRELWDRAPFGYLQVLAGALSRARLERDAAGGRGLVWTTIARSDREARDVPYDQLEGVIDQLRRTDEAEVAVVLKENDRGEWYVSTRAKGAVDVGRACVELGGGGHRTAAAFTMGGEPAWIIDRLRGALREPGPDGE
ncbi:DHH family phosphoesterase [Actinomadura opuntiae]|uniref:DHH family phosphoesterase n=1 Tax=Actinomadura sp. OS1-43 TaxID=604315 RepID=UPI00255AF06E|nr:bifunctional oligoribonuclease/PAP phosphatase NrnA [Actinomadura sp. OS1-43]MDL4818164.1 bifunctional oligoribonuclease/PAP phosphatase NrnA [Actinomadura sp. OS1-43]